MSLSFPIQSTCRLAQTPCACNLSPLFENCWSWSGSHAPALSVSSPFPWPCACSPLPASPGYCAPLLVCIPSFGSVEARTFPEGLHVHRTSGCMHAPRGCSALRLAAARLLLFVILLSDRWGHTCRRIHSLGDCMCTVHVVACVPLGRSAPRPATVCLFLSAFPLPDQWRHIHF